jgi:hypothetical protein
LPFKCNLQRYAGGVHIWCVKVEGVHDRLSAGVVSEERLHKDSVKNKFLPHLPDTWMWTPSGFAQNGSPVTAASVPPTRGLAPRAPCTFRSGDVLWFLLDCDAGTMEMKKTAAGGAAAAAAATTAGGGQSEILHTFKRLPRGVYPVVCIDECDDKATLLQQHAFVARPTYKAAVERGGLEESCRVPIEGAAAAGVGGQSSQSTGQLSQSTGQSGQSRGAAETEAGNFVRAGEIMKKLSESNDSGDRNGMLGVCADVATRTLAVCHALAVSHAMGATGAGGSAAAAGLASGTGTGTGGTGTGRRTGPRAETGTGRRAGTGTQNINNDVGGIASRDISTAASRSSDALLAASTASGVRTMLSDEDDEFAAAFYSGRSASSLAARISLLRRCVMHAWRLCGTLRGGDIHVEVS